MQDKRTPEEKEAELNKQYQEMANEEPECDEAPVPLTKEEMVQVEEEKPRGRFQLSSTGGTIVAIALAVSIIVTLGYNMLFGDYVSKDDFATNLNNMNVTVANGVKQAKDVATSMNNTLQSLPVTIEGQVNSAVSAKVNEVNAAIAEVNKSIEYLNSKFVTVDTNYNKVVNDMAQLTTKTITEVNAALAEYDEDLETALNQLLDRIEVLEIKTTKPTIADGELEFISYGQSGYFYPGTGNTTVMAQLSFGIKNKSALDIDIEDVEIRFGAQLVYYGVPSVNFYSAYLIYGSYEQNIPLYGTYDVVISNVNKRVKAGATLQIPLTYKIALTGAAKDGQDYCSHIAMIPVMELLSMDYDID